MSKLRDNIKNVRRQIEMATERSGREPGSVKLLLATKTVTAEILREAVAAGETYFGENKVQEGRAKAMALDATSVTWSMIGHLQTNKVKDVIGYAQEVQSLDRLSLAEALDRHLQRAGRELDVLVQVNTSAEITKYGLAPDGVLPFLRSLTAFRSLRVRGFMTLASFTANELEIRRCFRLLKNIQEHAAQETSLGVDLKTLSMGMSNDFQIAIEEGATLVRIGQAVFGARHTSDLDYWPN